MEQRAKLYKRLRIDLPNESDSDELTTTDFTMASATLTETGKKSESSNVFFGPRTVGVLNRILSSIASNIEKGISEEQFIASCLLNEDFDLPNNPAIAEFATSVARTNLELLGNLTRYPDSELKNNVQNGLFSTFKEVRGELTKWHRSTAHFCNTKHNEAAKSTSLIQLTINYSPAVTDTKDIDRVAEILAKCTKRLSHELENSVITKLRSLQDHILDKWNKVSTAEEKFLWAKAYKSASRNSKDQRDKAPRFGGDTETEHSADDRSTDSHRQRRQRTFKRRRHYYSRQRYSEPSDSDDNLQRRRNSTTGQRGSHRRPFNQSSTPDDDDNVPRQRRRNSFRRRRNEDDVNEHSRRGIFRRVP